MLNNVTLVGRLNWCCEPKKSFQITIESREETIAVEIYANESIYNGLNDYCEVGNVIGVRGKVAKNEDNEIIIQAEKASILSSTINK